MHYTGQFRPFTEKEWSMEENSLYGDNWYTHLKKMPDNVSIKVAVLQPTGFKYPAFSLRRLDSQRQHGECAVSGGSFLHELIIHRMIDDVGEYRWDGLDRPNKRRVCKKGKYEANLIAVKVHPEGYLGEYSRTLPSLFNI
jgi:hypothetical protein